jgi:hypothetical protein
MTTEEILEQIKESYEECLTADGFDDAIVGIVEGSCREPVVCYDYAKCVEILTKDGEMDVDAAEEYLNFNTVGAYVGNLTPLFLHDWRRNGH